MSFFKIKDPNGSYKMANGSIISAKIGSKDAEPEIYTREELMQYIDALSIDDVEYNPNLKGSITIVFQPFPENIANAVVAYPGSIRCVLIRRQLSTGFVGEYANGKDTGKGVERTRGSKGRRDWPTGMDVFYDSRTDTRKRVTASIPLNYTFNATKEQLMSGRITLDGNANANLADNFPFMLSDMGGEFNKIHRHRSVGYYNNSYTNGRILMQYKAGLVGIANKNDSKMTNYALYEFKIDNYNILYRD